MINELRKAPINIKMLIAYLFIVVGIICYLIPMLGLVIVAILIVGSVIYSIGVVAYYFSEL
jgi:hypothetical protein